jgi:hypothetical protein
MKNQMDPFCSIHPKEDNLADWAIYWPQYRVESGADGEPIVGWLTNREWLVNRLQHGDRIWLFIPGNYCGDTKKPYQGYLAQLLMVEDWEQYSPEEMETHGSRYHIQGIEERCILVRPPICVDHLLRRPGTDPFQHIGVARQTPFELESQQVDALLWLLQNNQPEVYRLAVGS